MEKQPMVYIDPLGRAISVSFNEDGVGDHPAKHGVAHDAVRKTIEEPRQIYGSYDYPKTCYYVRINHGLPPDPQPKRSEEHMCFTVVKMTSENEGRAVTAYYTDYLSEKTVNIDDVRFDEKKDRKRK